MNPGGAFKRDGSTAFNSYTPYLEQTERGVRGVQVAAHHAVLDHRRALRVRVRLPVHGRRGVAVQVEFESKYETRISHVRFKG